MLFRSLFSLLVLIVLSSHVCCVRCHSSSLFLLLCFSSPSLRSMKASSHSSAAQRQEHSAATPKNPSTLRRLEGDGTAWSKVAAVRTRNGVLVPRRRVSVQL